MMDLIAELKKNDLLAHLPEDVIRESILPQGHLLTAPKGQVLIFPQQKVDRLGILLSGRVHIMHLFADGTQSLMSVLLPSKILGADLVCTKSQRAPYHAVAEADSQVFSLPVTLFTCPGSMPDDMRHSCLLQLLTLISQENMKKEYRLAILAQKGLRERIMVYLTMQADKHQNATFYVPFSREDMASFLCVNRSALSHELSQMQKEGLICFQKNHFTLYGPKGRVI